MNYSRAIKIARAVRGIEQKTVAEKANLTSSHISLIESGRRNLSVPALEAISKALDVPPHLLTLLAMDSSELEHLDPEQLKQAKESIARLILDLKFK